MEFDLIFRDLKIVDGTGNPYYFGDIGIKDDLIVKIGQIKEVGKTEYHCKGLTASPGFIDLHSHGEYAISLEPTAACYISQGVTSLVVGNCGGTLAPVNDNNYELYGYKLNQILGIKEISYANFLNVLDNMGKSINIIPLVAHGNIRSAVVGCKDVEIKEKDIEYMKIMLREAMEVGAFGFSTGLIYNPGIFAEPEEIIEFAKVVKEYDGIYSTHMRNESFMVIEAMLEAINVAKKTGISLELSHLKVSGKQKDGICELMLELIKYYRRLGLEISGDAYPSNYCKTGLINCLPPWTREKGMANFKKIINDKKITEKITEELKLPTTEWENLIWDAGLNDIRISVNNNKEMEKYNNMTIVEIAEELDMEPYEAVYDLLRKDVMIATIAGGVSQKDNTKIILNEAVSVCSDGNISANELGNTHPRSYMAFTKILTDFVRDNQLMTIENAVRKMTSMPARKLGIKDRGMLLEGFKADVAIFNYNHLKYNSTFEKPHSTSNGMAFVLVNGKIVLENEKTTNVFSGQLIRKNQN